MLDEMNKTYNYLNVNSVVIHAKKKILEDFWFKLRFYLLQRKS